MATLTALFSQPVAKLYDVLPPPREDLDDCLAVMLTGNISAQDIDLNRTPLLVRHRVVFAALKWLKLHHKDYRDVQISLENLQTYQEVENQLPVNIFYRATDGTVQSDSAAVHDNTEGLGTGTGQCSFSISGVTGNELEDICASDKIMHAVRHLRSGGKIAQYRHADKAESIYDNPRLFPGLFPWLFPYGYGAFGVATALEENRQKRVHLRPHVQYLLKYHDRRFQYSGRRTAFDQH
ncbi:hypothetical protein BXZ70DRAFT_999766 [Cristinia sonorae]|uniref:DUF6570 domain-containing protein n=1 Tax=Cristinia sonorae TaxID=1940300 RepID=A0A8K0XRL1_9AGAR|nr:hypothetical protein BXZ70DRAFT_999766 [Cristinia sonorae]